MNCKFCGKEIWLAGFFRDRDFCIPSHRKKFNERLRSVILQSEATEIKALRLAGPRFLAMPADCTMTAAPNARLSTIPMHHTASVSEIAWTEGLRVTAPQWEAEIEIEAAPVVAEAEPVAIEPLNLSVEAMPITPPAMPYDSRMQRVMNLISKMRGSSEVRKVSGLHAAA